MGLFDVAGPRIERGSQGYEPCEMPLLYPAILSVYPDVLLYYIIKPVFANKYLKNS